MTTERELLCRVAAWLAEFEGLDHACEGAEDVGDCGTCYGITLLADLERELVDLDAPQPLPLVDALADYDPDEE